MMMDSGEIVVSGWTKDTSNQQSREENIIFDCGKLLFNMLNRQIDLPYFPLGERKYIEKKKLSKIIQSLTRKWPNKKDDLTP